MLFLSDNLVALVINWTSCTKEKCNFTPFNRPELYNDLQIGHYCEWRVVEKKVFALKNIIRPLLVRRCEWKCEVCCSKAWKRFFFLEWILPAIAVVILTFLLFVNRVREAGSRYSFLTISTQFNVGVYILYSDHCEDQIELHMRVTDGRLNRRNFFLNSLKMLILCTYTLLA